MNSNNAHALAQSTEVQNTADQAPMKTWKVVMTDPDTNQVVVEDVQTREGGFDAIVRASMRCSGHGDDYHHMDVQCAICGDEVVFTSDEAGASTASTHDIVCDLSEPITPVPVEVYIERVLQKVAQGDTYLKSNIMAAFDSILDDWRAEGLNEHEMLKRALTLDYFEGFSVCICPRAYF